VRSYLLIGWSTVLSQLQKLKKIILEDELGLCSDLDREMDALVGTYQCEWTAVVNDSERRQQFRQFVKSVSGINTLVDSGVLTPRRRMSVKNKLNLS
jgi:hypothetical protein